MLRILYVYLTVGTTWLGESDGPHASGHQTLVVLPKRCLGRETEPARERWIAIPHRIRQPVGKHTTACRDVVLGVRQAQQRTM